MNQLLANEHVFLSHTASSIAAALGGGRKLKNGYWLTRCPSHEDNKDALIVKDGDNGPQIKCREGCHPDHVREYVKQELAENLRRTHAQLGGYALAVKDQMAKVELFRAYEVPSITRKARIDRSLKNIKKNAFELCHIYFDWLKWHASELKYKVSRLGE